METEKFELILLQCEIKIIAISLVGQRKKPDCCFACSRMPSHSKKKLSSQKFEIHLSRQMIKQRQKEETQTITRSTKTKKTQTNHKMKIQQLLQSKRK